jgi:signal transduction histidine kinase
MTENYAWQAREVRRMEARRVEVRREIDRLRVELDELRASRRRLVEATDAERRAIERDLHDGVHQQLVALAVGLQLARRAAADPAAAADALADVERDIRRALDETARLALRIHPPTLEAGDLGALLRSAATSAGVPAVVEVSARPGSSPDLVMTIHLCWLEALARAGGEARVTIEVRERDDALTFEIEGDAAGSEANLEGLRDRVEALGGAFAVESTAGGRRRVAGSLPVAR